MPPSIAEDSTALNQGQRRAALRSHTNEHSAISQRTHRDERPPETAVLAFSERQLTMSLTNASHLGSKTTGGRVKRNSIRSGTRARGSHPASVSQPIYIYSRFRKTHQQERSDTNPRSEHNSLMNIRPLLPPSSSHLCSIAQRLTRTCSEWRTPSVILFDLFVSRERVERRIVLKQPAQSARFRTLRAVR